MTYSAFEVDLYYTLRILDAQHDIVNQQLCTSHAFAHIYVNAYPHPFLLNCGLVLRRSRRYRLWFAPPLYCRTMPAYPDPVAVTLVSGTPEDLRWFKKEVEPHEWEVIELQEFMNLRDYRDLSRDDMHGSYEDHWVIRKVIGLEGFPAAVEDITKAARATADWNGAINIFIEGDLHRSSVTSACAESQLNSLVHTLVKPGWAPERKYNCNWFSFDKCSGTWTWQQQVANISDWVHTGGWELSVGPATEIAMFGYVAATKSLSSSKNWKELGMAIEGEHYRIWHESACLWYEDRDRQIEIERSRYPPGESDADIDAPIPMPDWVTFNKDATVWKKYLEKTGVDESAQQSLFLLAQDNYWEANSIISKLIKKAVDGRVLHNPSGFVFYSVLNVRNKGKPAYKCDRCGSQPDQ